MTSELIELIEEQAGIIEEQAKRIRMLAELLAQHYEVEQSELEEMMKQ